jgi:hypothetical protein
VDPSQQQQVLPPDSIAGWTQSVLIRFLRDFLDQQPINYLGTLRVDNLLVTSKLTLNDLLSLTKAPNFTIVGATGAAAFQNSWVAGTAGDSAPAYWKDPLGFVHLRGAVKNGTVNAAAFTLPPGYRSPARARFPSVQNGVFGIVDINADGTVVPVTSNVLASLDGIRFRLT